MRFHLLTNLACCGCLAMAVTAYAQDRDRDDRYRDEDRYHGEARSDSWWQGRLFQRVRVDLDHVQAASPRFRGDQYRLDKVREELNELQTKYAARGYDQPELDDVISALQRVVSDNQLTERDHEMLGDDLTRLREFREHHEGYR
jgi:hypothetical protein